MKDRFFIDTNIFIYSVSPKEGTKHDIARNIIKTSFDKKIGCISYQVIQEFLNVAINKFKTPLSAKECKQFLGEILEPLCTIYPSLDLYFLAIDIRERFKFGFYDSLIVGSAIEAGCQILYSEDLHHKQKIGDLEIVNPFL